jgi:hypothetical protein
VSAALACMVRPGLLPRLHSPAHPCQDLFYRRRAFYDKRVSQEVDGESLGEVRRLLACCRLRCVLVCSVRQQGGVAWGTTRQLRTAAAVNQHTAAAAGARQWAREAGKPWLFYKYTAAARPCSMLWNMSFAAV